MADVKVGLEADISNLKTGLQKAQAEIEQFKQKAKAKMEGGGGIFGGMTKQWLGRAALTGMAARMISAVAETAETLSDMIRERTASARQTAKSLAGATSSQARGVAGSKADEAFAARQEIERERGKRTLAGMLSSPLEWLQSFRKVDQLKEKEKQAREEQRKAATEAIKAGSKELEIGALRARGQDSLADAKQRELDYENEILKINQEGAGLNDDQRRALFDQAGARKRLADAAASISENEKFGVTAVASSKAALGLGGGVAMFGQNPNEGVAKQALATIDAILTTLQQRNGTTTTPNFSRGDSPRGTPAP